MEPSKEVQVPCNRCGEESGADIEGTSLVLFERDGKLESFTYCVSCSLTVNNRLNEVLVKADSDA